MSLSVDVWPNSLNVWREKAVCIGQQKGQLSTPVSCLWFACLRVYLAYCAVTLKQEKIIFWRLFSLSSLAYQRTFNLWEWPFKKFYFICSKSSFLKKFCVKMDISLPEKGSSILSAHFGIGWTILTCLQKMQGWKNICEPSQSRNAKKSERITVFATPFCLLLLVALLCIKLFSVQCLSNKYCGLFCKWNVLCWKLLAVQK